MVAMEIMEDVSARHDIVTLFHEKPFAGLNGSGKHNNWGLNTDSGKNLFAPGSTTESQTDFFAFTAALARALHVHGDVIRVGVATAGNDHRLGAQEAPPAIISLYPGQNMEDHIRKIVAGGDLPGYSSEGQHVMAGARTCRVLHNDYHFSNSYKNLTVNSSHLEHQLSLEHRYRVSDSRWYRGQKSYRTVPVLWKQIRVPCSGICSEHRTSSCTSQHGNGRVHRCSCRSY